MLSESTSEEGEKSISPHHPHEDASHALALATVSHNMWIRHPLTVQFDAIVEGCMGVEEIEYAVAGDRPRDEGHMVVSKSSSPTKQRCSY